ncbi:MAG: hypothetical protein F6K24_49635 [Okeania sp. SIO2D1]|nr:hypothetical protein [Okeania sp. SIO2D1]
MSVLSWSFNLGGRGFYHSAFGLSGARETISISGLRDASLKIALSIQKCYPQPIIAVDSDYSFELVLDKINSLEKLCKKILESSDQTVS